MLLRFSVSNHSSLRLKQEVSLVATRLKDADAGLIESVAVPSEKILPSIVIYGANASGKTSTIEALSFLRKSVVFSHSQGDPKGGVPRNKFRLDNEELPSEFEADFIVDNIRYQYGLRVNDTEMEAEWLSSFPSGRKTMLFIRTGPKEIDFGRSLRGRNRVIADLMRNNSSFLSTAMQNSHETLTPIANFFLNIEIDKNIHVAGSSLASRFGNVKVDDRTIAFLAKIGTGVNGYRHAQMVPDPDAVKLTKALYDVMRQQMPDAGPRDFSEKLQILELQHQGMHGQKVFFRPEAESSGTRRLLVLVSQAFKALDQGSLLVVDELDVSIHTKASELLISMFSDKAMNTKGAQLIATTHDTNLMLSDVLRRDQIWFAEKDDEGSTSIFPLSDFQTRQSDNVERGYLQGRFGAIPFSGSTEQLLKKIV